MNQDHYTTLGVDRTANTADIKRAYRELAMQHHPDRNPGDQDAEEQFKIVTEAYEVLSDVGRRAEYDQILDSAADKEAEKKAATPEEFYQHSDEMVRDFMHGFYGRGQRKKKARQGDNLRFNLKVSFEEAALGAEKEIKVPGTKTCPTCKGSGVQAGSKMVRCRECRGRGKVRNSRGLYEVCRNCNGTGTVVTAYCKRCTGEGEVTTNRKIHVRVPPGIETGTRVQVKGMGLEGKDGGGAGDFFVVVHVGKHKMLERDGNDIRCTVPVPLFQALLGCTIEVPTLGGVKKLKLPAGSCNDYRKRLRGLGFRSPETGRRGDQVVEVQIETPKKLSRDLKRALKEFETKTTSEHYPKTAAFKKKIEKL